MIPLLQTLLIASLLSPAPAPPAPDYQALVSGFVEDTDLIGTDISVSVIEVASNRLVAAHQPDNVLIPASSLKTVTTATALAVLGADFRYTTRLLIDGTVTDGVLDGDVILLGGGDPALASRRLDDRPDLETLLQQCAQALQARGIRQVEGYVIGDGMAFNPQDAVAPSWEEKDMGNYYASGVWGLNIHDNLYHLHFRQQSRVGGKPIYEGIEPEVPGLKLVSYVTLAGRNTGDNAYIHGKPYQYDRKVTGTIPAGSGRFSIKGSLPDPPAFAAYHLKRQLEGAGITVKGAATTRRELLQRGYRGKGAKSLVRDWKSPPLSTLARIANVESDNLYCEAFLRSVGQVKSGHPGRLSGLRGLRNLWNERGLDLSGARLEDGSGLSTQNRISSRDLAAVLRKAVVDSKLFGSFVQTLPNPANSKYLASRFRTVPGARRLYAKSGSMQGVRTYSGLFKDAAGKWYAFSILVNEVEADKENRVRYRTEQLLGDFCG